MSIIKTIPSNYIFLQERESKISTLLHTEKKVNMVFRSVLAIISVILSTSLLACSFAFAPLLPLFIPIVITLFTGSVAYACAIYRENKKANKQEQNKLEFNKILLEFNNKQTRHKEQIAKKEAKIQTFNAQEKKGSPVDHLLKIDQRCSLLNISNAKQKEIKDSSLQQLFRAPLLNNDFPTGKPIHPSQFPFSPETESGEAQIQIETLKLRAKFLLKNLPDDEEQKRNKLLNEASREYENIRNKHEEQIIRNNIKNIGSTPNNQRIFDSSLLPYKFAVRQFFNSAPPYC